MFRDGHTPSLKDLKFATRIFGSAALAVTPAMVAQAFAAPRVEAAGPCEVGAGVRAVDSEGNPAVGQQITISSPYSKDGGFLITGKDGVGLSPTRRDSRGNPERYAFLKGESNTIVGGREDMTVLFQAGKEPAKPFNLDCGWKSTAQPLEIKNLTLPFPIPEATRGERTSTKDILIALHNIPVLKEIGDLSDATGLWINNRITDLHNSDKSWRDAGKFFSDLGSTIHEHPVAGYIGDNLNFLILPVLLILRNRLYRRHR